MRESFDGPSPRAGAPDPEQSAGIDMAPVAAAPLTDQELKDLHAPGALADFAREGNEREAVRRLVHDAVDIFLNVTLLTPGHPPLDVARLWNEAGAQAVAAVNEFRSRHRR